MCGDDIFGLFDSPLFQTAAGAAHPMIMIDLNKTIPHWQQRRLSTTPHPPPHPPKL
jgi:hypothetical protein